MLYRITHTTRYSYTAPVSLCHNVAHLTPRTTPRQACRTTGLRVTPQPAVTVTRNDYFGNPATFFTIQESHRELTVTASHVVDVGPADLPEPAATLPWEAVSDRLAGDRSPAGLDAYEFTLDSPYVAAGPDLAAYARTSFTPGRPVLAAAVDLTSRIYHDFKYDPRATTVATPLRDVLAHRRGVCQDFAHLQVGCLRSLGLPARYVSGYLRTVQPPGQERLAGADASHAWVSVYVGDGRWVDLDPTNDRPASDQHVLLAWGRDYDDVSPVKGVILGGGRHTVSVEVDVEPVGE